MCGSHHVFLRAIITAFVSVEPKSSVKSASYVLARVPVVFVAAAWPSNRLARKRTRGAASIRKWAVVATTRSFFPNSQGKGQTGSTLQGRAGLQTGLSLPLIMFMFDGFSGCRLHP